MGNDETTGQTGRSLRKAEIFVRRRQNWMLRAREVAREEQRCIAQGNIRRAESCAQRKREYVRLARLSNHLAIRAIQGEPASKVVSGGNVQ